MTQDTSTVTAFPGPPVVRLERLPTVAPPQVREQPLFWEVLSEVDKERFNRMRSALASPACKHRRHHTAQINNDILSAIKSFVVRNDQDDWRRALVCGIYWMPDGIAINTRQLRILLSKCKSSINALFQNLGYTTTPASSEFASALVRIFPMLKDNFPELRKWTQRVAGVPKQQGQKQEGSAEGAQQVVMPPPNDQQNPPMFTAKKENQ